MNARQPFRSQAWMGKSHTLQEDPLKSHFPWPVEILSRQTMHGAKATQCGQVENGSSLNSYPVLLLSIIREISKQWQPLFHGPLPCRYGDWRVWTSFPRLGEYCGSAYRKHSLSRGRVGYQGIRSRLMGSVLRSATASLYDLEQLSCLSLPHSKMGAVTLS